MPYTFLHDGLVREFDFYAPPGWEYWVGKAWEHGHVGLPLVVALHGGGEDPLVFQEDWFFPRVWNLGLDGNGNPGDPVFPGASRHLENQFFVLYPYGFGWTTGSLFLRAYGLVEPPAIPVAPAGVNLRPLYRNESTLRGFNSGFMEPGPLQNDVSFIKAAIEAMNEKLKVALLAAESNLPNDFPWEYFPAGPQVLEKKSPDLFDVDGRYVFGYSQGAMLAHRLVSKMEDYWAALWAMSGTCGGKPYNLASSDNFKVVNLPETGNFAVSFFAHHGDLDKTVPPGDWGEADFSYQFAEFPDPGFLKYAVGGFPNTLDYRPGLLPLSQASRGYRNYNNFTGSSPFRERKGLGGPATAQSKSWPDAAEPDNQNPTVVIYRDWNMAHTGFTSNPNRYFFEKDVWRFFGRHPRVAR